MSHFLFLGSKALQIFVEVDIYLENEKLRKWENFGDFRLEMKIGKNEIFFLFSVNCLGIFLPSDGLFLFLPKSLSPGRMYQIDKLHVVFISNHFLRLSLKVLSVNCNFTLRVAKWLLIVHFLIPLEKHGLFWVYFTLFEYFPTLYYNIETSKQEIDPPILKSIKIWKLEKSNDANSRKWVDKIHMVRNPILGQIWI